MLLYWSSASAFVMNCDRAEQDGRLRHPENIQERNKVRSLAGVSLALLCGIKTHKQYLYGCKFEAVTDYLPLLAFYNSMNRPAPVRIDRHRSNLRAFKFRLVYIEGHKMPCDYASQHPPPDRDYSKQEREDMGVEDEEEDQEYSVNRMVEDNLPPAVTMKILRKSMRDGKEWTAFIILSTKNFSSNLGEEMIDM